MYQQISIHCKRHYVRTVRGISKNHKFPPRTGRTQYLNRRDLHRTVIDTQCQLPSSLVPRLSPRAMTNRRVGGEPGNEATP